jgi:NADP-dependent 3-hydroxy acid dehydrogenase YdfG
MLNRLTRFKIEDMNDLNQLINQRIAGKKVLVTGGTTGIGRATALLLAAHGAKVMVFGRHRAEVDETLAELMCFDQETSCYGMVADVADPKDIQRVFEMVDSQLRGLDILINNAAVAYQSIMEGGYQDWQYVVQTNLTGYMACCHEAINRMQHRSFTHIVNIGSMSADVREENSSVYVATKAAVQGFSEALRKEVNPLGIKVTLIEPGATDTDLQEGSSAEKQELVDELKMLKADDVAWSILFCLAQPLRADVVSLQIRPHLQLI